MPRRCTHSKRLAVAAQIRVIFGFGSFGFVSDGAFRPFLAYIHNRVYCLPVLGSFSKLAIPKRHIMSSKLCIINRLQLRVRCQTYYPRGVPCAPWRQQLSINWAICILRASPITAPRWPRDCPICTLSPLCLHSRSIALRKISSGRIVAAQLEPVWQRHNSRVDKQPIPTSNHAQGRLTPCS